MSQHADKGGDQILKTDKIGIHKIGIRTPSKLHIYFRFVVFETLDVQGVPIKMPPPTVVRPAVATVQDKIKRMSPKCSQSLRK